MRSLRTKQSDNTQLWSFHLWIGHILPYHAITCHLLCHGYSVFQILRCILKWYWATINARVFTGGASGKEPACQCRRHERLMFNPWVGKIPWSRKWQPTPVLLPGESHGQRSLAGCGPWDHKSQILLKQLSTAQCKENKKSCCSEMFYETGVMWSQKRHLVGLLEHYMKSSFAVSSEGQLCAGCMPGCCCLVTKLCLTLLWPHGL